MEGFGPATPFARLVADRLSGDPFTLLDIGCSSGIDAMWRVFGEHLLAFGFDPNIDEIARLTADEALPGVSYVAAFVGVPACDRGAKRLRAQNYWSRNPWSRLSVARTMTRNADRFSAADNESKTKLNLWPEVRLANPDQPLILPAFLSDRGVTNVDFIKLDVDGPDFLILRSLVPLMNDMRVLGVGVEVNFFGTDEPDIHTFHNVDRLMRSCGFELFSLSTRHYSKAALPAPYEYVVPAQSKWGRPLQGDAIYLRDAAAPEHAEWAARAGAHKLAKLAALFSLAGLPDCAAEVLQVFGDNLAVLFDLNAGLDALVQQCSAEGLSYAQYLAEFDADADRFYPARRAAEPAPEQPKTVLLARLAEALAKASAAEVESRTRQAAEASAASARADVARLNELVSRLYASTSWRITAPLRALAAALRTG